MYRDKDSLVVKVSKFIHQILLSTFLQEFGLVFLLITNDLRWTFGRAVLNSFNRFTHSICDTSLVEHKIQNGFFSNCTDMPIVQRLKY